MLLPLDGPALHGKQTINTTTPFRVKVNANELPERKIVTIQPLTGKIYIFFGYDENVPTVSDIQGGFIQFKNALHSYEASNEQFVYILAVTGTVDVAFAERA